MTEPLYRTWYVVFSDPGRKSARWFRPFQVFSPKKFRHVQLISDLGSSTQLFDPHDNQLATDVLDRPLARKIAVDICKCKPVVMFTHPTGQPIKNTFSLLPTCVSLVKYIMGYYPTCTTPYKLYLNLLKDGGVDVGYLVHGKLDYHTDKALELINGKN